MPLLLPGCEKSIAALFEAGLSAANFLKIELKHGLHAFLWFGFFFIAKRIGCTDKGFYFCNFPIIDNFNRGNISF